MKMTVQHVFIRSTDPVDSMIEERILALRSRLEIEEARVRLAHERNASPPYSVAVHLVTPGPDVIVESRDHTIRAAIDKAVHEIEMKIAHRRNKPLKRVRSNLQEPASLRSGRNRI